MKGWTQGEESETPGVCTPTVLPCASTVIPLYFAVLPLCFPVLPRTSTIFPLYFDCTLLYSSVLSVLPLYSPVLSCAPLYFHCTFLCSPVLPLYCRCTPLNFHCTSTVLSLYSHCTLGVRKFRPFPPWLDFNIIEKIDLIYIRKKFLNVKYNIYIYI